MIESGRMTSPISTQPSRSNIFLHEARLLHDVDDDGCPLKCVKHDLHSENHLKIFMVPGLVYAMIL